jgi:glycosyltransferase involved in cell wall biosynthesis
VAMVQDAIGRVPTVFDAVDCVSMFESQRNRLLRNPILRLISRMDSKRMARGEAKASQSFDRIVISSRLDKDCYAVPSHLRERVRVLPNAVDLDHFRFQQFESQKNRIVFCAKLDYFPNQDAALYFAQSVWPLLHKRRPGLHLDIVGSRPPRGVRRLDGKDNISVLPSVADVRPHLGCAWVALCPVRLQAGTQFKILEAMALGVPVVATRICCPSLAVEAGKHLLVADTPEEFVNAVESLLDNEVLRENLARAGRTFVERHYDWAESVRSLDETYAQAALEFAGHKSESVQPAAVCLKS